MKEEGIKYLTSSQTGDLKNEKLKWGIKNLLSGIQNQKMERIGWT
jgi:hypothetical protein